MATYAEIAGLFNPDNADAQVLREKIFVAALVKAETIRNETPAPTDAVVQARKRFSQSLVRERVKLETARSLGLATASYENNLFESIYRGVIIANRSADLSQINSATDAQIQSEVNDIIDHLAAQYPDPTV